MNRKQGIYHLLHAASVLLALLCAPFVPVTYAQNSSKEARPSFIYSHEAPRPETLPYPGQPLKLVLTLTNSRDSRHQVKLLGTKDGTLLEVSGADALYNDFDQPIWIINTPSPIGEIVYEFIITNIDGSTQRTPRFVVRRHCLPDVSLANPEVRPEVQGFKRLERLVNESKNLEQDLASYDRALGILNELKGRLQ